MRYRRRVSGPLLDRIDLQVEVPRVPVRDLGRGEGGETSATVARRVAAARRVQIRRQGRLNAHLDIAGTERWCLPEPGAQRLLEQALETLGLSARAYHRVLRVSRTLADLEGSAGIREHHVAEAVQYRALDRSAAMEG
jgi:magnesium chelatase family protein